MADERIIRRHTPVVVQAHDRAHMVGEILGWVVREQVRRRHPVADRHVQVSLVVEGHAP